MSNKLNEKLVKSVLTVKEDESLKKAIAAEIAENAETECNESEKLETLWNQSKTLQGRAAAK